jgi:hypothetical protein
VIDPPSDAELRRRCQAAIVELLGHVDMREAWRLLRLAVDRYLGPAVGMSFAERWETMPQLERELLCDVLEERSAIRFFS